MPIERKRKFLETSDLGIAHLSNFDVVNERDWEYLYIDIQGKTVANKKSNRTATPSGI